MRLPILVIFYLINLLCLSQDTTIVSNKFWIQNQYYTDEHNFRDRYKIKVDFILIKYGNDSTRKWRVRMPFESDSIHIDFPKSSFMDLDLREKDELGFIISDSLSNLKRNNIIDIKSITYFHNGTINKIYSLEYDMDKVIITSDHIRPNISYGDHLIKAGRN